MQLSAPSVFWSLEYVKLIIWIPSRKHGETAPPTTRAFATMAVRDGWKSMRRRLRMQRQRQLTRDVAHDKPVSALAHLSSRAKSSEPRWKRGRAAR